MNRIRSVMWLLSGEGRSLYWRLLNVNRAGGLAFRWHNHTVGTPSFACVSRREGSSLFAQWNFHSAQGRNEIRPQPCKTTPKQYNSGDSELKNSALKNVDGFKRSWRNGV